MTKNIFLQLIIFFLSLASTLIFAATPINIVGTWKPVSANISKSDLSKNPPSLEFKNKSALVKFTIDKQDEGSFTGTRHYRDGRTESFVGAFKSDGKNFIYSDKTHIGFGETDGMELENCYADIVSTVNIAGCTKYVKVSP